MGEKRRDKKKEKQKGEKTEKRGEKRIMPSTLFKISYFSIHKE